MKKFVFMFLAAILLALSVNGCRLSDNPTTVIVVIEETPMAAEGGN